MENNNNSDSVSNLRDQQTGLDPDLSEGDSFTTVIVTLTWSLMLLLTKNTFNRVLPYLIEKKNSLLRKGFEKNNHKNRIELRWNVIYYMSKPRFNRCRKRMHAIWIAQGMFDITKQSLMDEKDQTMKKQWLTNFELQEIQKKTEDESRG